MGDVVKEQLVKRAPSAKDTLARFGIVALAVVFVFVCTLIPILQALFIFILAGAAWGAYFFISRRNVEFEYTFINGDLDIDAIYNKQSRKRLFSSTVRDFEIMAHVEDTAHAREMSNIGETKDYSSGVVGPNTYAFVTPYKGKRLKIIFEPNDMMLKAFSTVLTPRKLYKKL